MTNFEIFIWGNPSGFRMLAPNLPANLLTVQERSSLNPDVFDSFKSGEFYSFAYAKDSYVVSCHFFAKDKSKILREGRTVISVAVRRGYIFGDMSLMLDKLRDVYNELLAGIANVNSLDDEVSLLINRWTRDFEQYCKQDSDQLCINQFGTAKQRSIVSYQSDNDRNALLNCPIRPEYIGSYLVFIAPQQDIENFRGTLQMMQFNPLIVSPVYSPIFQIYFPSWKGNAQIASVSSVNEKISLTCEKKFYKTIRLEGSIEDHLVDWKVNRTADKTGYIIGLDFEAEEQRHPVIVKSADTGTNVQFLSWLDFNIGKFDTIHNELVLRGEEMAGQLKPVSKVEIKQIEKEQINNDGSIEILVREYSVHDCTELKKYLRNRYQIEPNFTIIPKKEGGKCINSKKSENTILFLGKANDYELTISETDRFEKLSIPLDTEPQTIMLKEKAGLTLTVNYTKDLEAWLLAKRDRNISYSLQYEDKEDDQEEHLYLPPNNVIKLPATKKRRNIKFWAKGFKSKIVEPYSSSGEETMTLDLSPTIGTFFSKLLVKLAVPFILFFLGTVFGSLIVCPLCKHPNLVFQGELADSTEIVSIKKGNDSLVQINSALKDTITELKREIDDLNKSLKEIETIVSKQSISRPESTVSLISLAGFNNKLDGIEYTESDYADGVKNAKAKGKYDKLKKYFEARSKALAFCVDVDSRSKTEYFKSFLTINRNYLTLEQVNAFQKIDANLELFSSCSATNIKTIKDILNELDIE